MSLSLQNTIPALRYKTATSMNRVWATTGNTDAVTDSNVSTNSIILINNTSAYAGRWYVVCSQGSFTVTSSSSESATTTTYNYIIL